MGHILTNFHVVEDARQVSVTLHDGKTYDATFVGADPINDVSIIKTQEPDDDVARGSREGPIEYVTPPGYADTATSGLTATIKPGRNTGESVSFDLKGTFGKK